MSQSALKQSTCAYCGVGCGVDITVNDSKATQLQGTPEHPANFGRLCVKGTHLLDTLSLDNRLLKPEVDGQIATWDEAINQVASRFKDIIAKHGKEAVAFYVSGQLLTEDYYVANKLMKGYIGTANIDTNSRLCMSSAVAGYKRAFGEDVVPCSYDDLEQTELLILIGSNAAWTHPVLYQRMERAKQLNPAMKVVVIDPRKTASVELADQFLQIKPGTDAALYNGLVNYLATHDALDTCFINDYTSGFDDTLKSVAPWSITQVAEYCQITEQAVADFYQLFCDSHSAVSFFSMGINQSSTGVDKCNAIINAHLASGKLLKPGCGPFSITGQPNAMGGREVGGLANQLASHMDIENPAHRDRVQRFWNSPTIATQSGAKAVDMFDDIAKGKIKAVWVMATNPMVSLPNTDAIEHALNQCELVVVSDCVAKNDTLSFADIKLPATGWIEKNGTVTNSERRISRQRGIMQPAGQAKHDWQIICDVAKAMDFTGFDFNHPAEIFDEWAQLTHFENYGQRQLDLSALVGMNQAQYDSMRPVQWPLTHGSHHLAGSVFNNNHFSTPTGKANFIAVTPQLPIQQSSTEFPFVMNSGRVRDHWHTMTRTGNSSVLSNHIARPYIEIHPKDATRLAISQDDFVTASSVTGEVTAHAQVTDTVRVGECFMPIHWNQQFASSANAGKLYQGVVDPLSGQPESKHAAVNLARVEFAQYVDLFVAKELVINSDFWVKTRASHCIKYQVAFSQSKTDILNWCQQVTGILGQWSMFSVGAQLNIQCLKAGKVVAAAFVANYQQQTSLDWLNHLFSNESLEFSQLQSLLSAQPDEEFTQGKQVCSCFKVREKTIIDAISCGADSVDKLGAKLKCGTNCGSCKTELSQIIKAHADKNSYAISLVGG